ncbi:MAG: hypothetical protein JW839_16895 [Candidatus Lokiarchaeota archaeon]|nr:hypothetical protein [Candidatus Lokiarchaeota archaeon]
MNKTIQTMIFGVISASLGIISSFVWDYYKILAIVAIILGFAATALAVSRKPVERMALIGGILGIVGILSGFASLIGWYIISLLFWG